METNKNYEAKRKALLRRYHALLGKAGAGEEVKRLTAAAYGHTSSREFTVAELIEVCERLEGKTRPAVKATNDLNVWRKRVIACVGGFLRSTGQRSDIDYIKGTACRAAKCKIFNEITLPKLVKIYNHFGEQQDAKKMTAPKTAIYLN